MREFKILAVVLFFTAVVYWGVEPFAHSQMHPHVAPADYDFARGDVAYAKEMSQQAQELHAKAKDELKKLEQAGDKDKIKAAQKVVESAQKEVTATQDKLATITTFWKELEPMRALRGNAIKGAETFLSAGCVGCHSVTSQGMPAPMDNATASATFGVVPPDLSTAGALYDKFFLAALIKDPTKALKVEHKFNETRPHPMIQFFGLGGNLDQEIVDIVAYLQSIAPVAQMDDKKVYADACQRCHDIAYDKLISNTDKTALKAYMGTTPPDLSMMIRSKGADYLTTFINNPQKQLLGTSMPRVGLTEKAQNQVIAYMEKVGDRKKAEREDLGYKLIGYMAIFTLLAYLWKVKIWRKVH